MLVVREGPLGSGLVEEDEEEVEEKEKFDDPQR